ncbi:flagellar brake protein [Desulfurobacterium thermolithotrophum]|nr:PilZ domain-containing protein [Desulfurobacterium thermolithotrophum]
MNRIDFLKLPSADIMTVTVFVLIIVLIVLFFLLAGIIKEYLREKNLRISFFKEALERSLTKEEAAVLWNFSKKMGRDPFLSLEFKAPFEKVVDLYIKTDPNAKEEIIQDMRTKLGFDFVPYFVPLTSTKDIELFQPGKLYVDNLSFDVALFDKDERFMYWAIIEEIPSNLSLIEKKVKISFIRKNDGIYALEGTVKETYIDNGKLVLKIPHTFELTRYQRREYARVEVEIDGLLGIYDKREDKIIWYKGKIVDISAGGLKLCIPISELKEEITPMTEVVVKFQLSGKDFPIRSVVVNVYPKRYSTCYGIKFEKIKPEDQEFIHDFVKKEQQKLAQLAVKNKT